MPDPLPLQVFPSSVIAPPIGATTVPKEEEIKSTPATSVMMKHLNEMVIGIVIVLFIGFAGMFVAVAAMLVDSWNSDKNSTINMQYQIFLLNEKIDSMHTQMRLLSGS